MTINVAAPSLGCTATPQQPTSAGKPPFLPGSLSLPVGDKLSRGLVWQPDSSLDGWCVTGLGCLGCVMLGYIAASSCPLPTGAVDRSYGKPLFRNLNLEARHFNLGFSFESVVLLEPKSLIHCPEDILVLSVALSVLWMRMSQMPTETTWK